MMKEIDILIKINILENEKSKLLKNLNTIHSCKKMRCMNCKKLTAINKITAIQTYWYTEPHGCTEGDYWNRGELNYICPKCEIINRLLFDNYDVENWLDRKKYEFDPEAQFIRIYKHLFDKVLETRNKDCPAGRFLNNYYVDERRKQFGLAEKRKK